jgi:hypothetical protein
MHKSLATHKACQSYKLHPRSKRFQAPVVSHYFGFIRIVTENQSSSSLSHYTPGGLSCHDMPTHTIREQRTSQDTGRLQVSFSIEGKARMSGALGGRQGTGEAEVPSLSLARAVTEPSERHCFSFRYIAITFAMTSLPLAHLPLVLQKVEAQQPPPRHPKCSAYYRCSQAWSQRDLS